MLYGPSKEPSHRQNVRGRLGLRSINSGAAREKPKALFEPDNFALASSPQPPRAARRKTPPDKADSDLL